MRNLKLFAIMLVALTMTLGLAGWSAGGQSQVSADTDTAQTFQVAEHHGHMDKDHDKDKDRDKDKDKDKECDKDKDKDKDKDRGGY